MTDKAPHGENRRAHEAAVDHQWRQWLAEWQSLHTQRDVGCRTSVSNSHSCSRLCTGNNTR